MGEGGGRGEGNMDKLPVTGERSTSTSEAKLQGAPQAADAAVITPLEKLSVQALPDLTSRAAETELSSTPPGHGPRGDAPRWPSPWPPTPTPT